MLRRPAHGSYADSACVHTSGATAVVPSSVHALMLPAHSIRSWIDAAHRQRLRNLVDGEDVGSEAHAHPVGRGDLQHLIEGADHDVLEAGVDLRLLPQKAL